MQTNPDWTKKGGSLSDKSARKEFGLTQEEIIQGIREGKLQFRENNVYGNPYLLMLRKEVESYAKGKHGTGKFEEKKNLNELKSIEKEIRELKKKITDLEMRKKQIISSRDS